MAIFLPRQSGNLLASCHASRLRHHLLRLSSLRCGCAPPPPPRPVTDYIHQQGIKWWSGSEQKETPAMASSAVKIYYNAADTGDGASEITSVSSNGIQIYAIEERESASAQRTTLLAPFTDAPARARQPPPAHQPPPPPRARQPPARGSNHLRLSHLSLVAVRASSPAPPPPDRTISGASAAATVLPPRVSDSSPVAADPVDAIADPHRGGPAAPVPEVLRRRGVLVLICAGKSHRGRRRQPEAPFGHSSVSSTPAARPSDPHRHGDAPVRCDAAILEKSAVRSRGRSGGAELHRPRPRRTPSRAPVVVLLDSGWIPMMDHREVIQEATWVPTRVPGTNTCLGTKVNHPGSHKACRSCRMEWRRCHPISQ
ncbi:hypothetical protein EJB05_17177, partial [Eragrostis curvula]